MSASMYRDWPQETYENTRQFQPEAWDYLDSLANNPVSEAIQANADAINDHFDIRVYVGTHGTGLGPSEYDSLNPQYDAVKRIVDRLDPERDVLFTEGYGFTPEDPTAPLDKLPVPLTDEERLTLHRHTKNPRIVAESKRLLDYDKGMRAAETYAEKEREHFTITAWEYATAKARRRGIHTLHADLDGPTYAAVQDLARLDPTKLVDTPEEFVQRINLQEAIIAQRAQAAVRIMGQHAMSRLSEPLPTSSPKQRLNLFFGVGDLEHLEKAFASHNLRANFIVMAPEALIKIPFITSLGDAAVYNSLFGPENMSAQDSTTTDTL